jgi:hypothetical protein
VRSTPSELATSEHELRSELSSRPTLSARREYTTGNLQTVSPSTGASTVSEMAPELDQGFQKSFVIGPIQVEVPVELPLTIPASANPSVRGLPTLRTRYEHQQATGVPALNVDLSRAFGSSASGERGSHVLLPEAHDQYTHDGGGNSSSAVYSTFEELVSARKTSGPASFRDTDKEQAMTNNPVRVSTVLNPLREESDPSRQYKGDAKRPERKHPNSELSFAAKQRLPHSTPKSSLSLLRPPKPSLQHMSSASTISSVASDVSEMSVADSINLDAYNQRAEEREKRDRLRLMASNSTLAFSDIE